MPLHELSDYIHVVEGKYDKIKLSSILDAVILVTNGFHIFHDAEKMSLIRYYAKTTGVIILTDSDTAGFKIRHYLKGAVHEGKLYHVYIPDIYGKERRKDKPSAEGKLGVEGIDKKRLLEAFGKAGILAEEAPEKTDPITILDALHRGFPGNWLPGRRGTALGDRIFLEPGDKFDWPDLSAPEYPAPYFCYGLRDQLGILWDGTVVPCCLDASISVADNLSA